VVKHEGEHYMYYLVNLIYDEIWRSSLDRKTLENIAKTSYSHLLVEVFSEQEYKEWKERMAAIDTKPTGTMARIINR
jgi:hypothetical protein